MPNILSHQSQAVTKMLLLGDSGTGKTGALYSLAEAGYNLRILDLDNGADVVAALARKGKPETAARITYETITEKMKTLGGKPVIDGLPMAAKKAMDLLEHWKIPDKINPTTKEVIEPGYDLGKVSSWGPKDVLVIDSLTMLSNMVFNHVLSIVGRLGQPKQIGDWGQAMDMVESILALLYSDHIKCNVIVISHITLLGGDPDTGAGAKGFPSTLGSKLPPKVPTYFNTCIQAVRKGYGPAAKRLLLTTPEGNIDLKQPAMEAMPREVPIQTGLATIFQKLRE